MSTPTARVVPRTGSVFAAVVVGETTKLRSVHSTYWTLAAALLTGIVLPALFCANFAARYPHMSAQDKAGFDPVAYSLNGVYIAQVAVGALGVLVLTSEYSTGLIRTTLTATPQRRTLLTAKITVFTTAMLLVGEAISFGGFLLGQALLHSQHLGASLTAPGVARAVVGGGLYLAAIGLLGCALGAVIRHTAGALTVFFALLFGTSLVAALLPGSWRVRTLKYAPANAGSQILTTHPTANALGPWTGYGMLVLYTAAILIVGYLLIGRRDA